MFRSIVSIILLILKLLFVLVYLSTVFSTLGRFRIMILENLRRDALNRNK